MKNNKSSLKIRQQDILRNFHRGSKIKTWSEVPVSNKNVIKKFKTPKSFLELRVTSGSTGLPLYVFYSKQAVHHFISRAIKSLKKSGVAKDDIVLNLFAYGNYVPGSMYEKACQKMDISVIPLGAPNTYPKDKMIEAIKKIRPNVWLSVPSYAISLLNLLAQEKKSRYFPKKIIVAGERLLDSYTDTFKRYGIEVINHFGLTECPAIGVSKKDDPQKITVISNGIYVEAIEIKNLKHLVVTDLYNLATPIIRYKTGDILDNVKYNRNGSLKEFEIINRSDDLIKVQGILTSKTKIIDSLLKFTDQFMVYIKTNNDRDLVEIFIDNKVKKKEAEINETLNFLKNKKIIFQKNIDASKTSSYKNKYIADLRK
ncbi:MAG: AMP-binding protein [Candidatus Paceibacterota bacterium]